VVETNFELVAATVELLVLILVTFFGCSSSGKTGFGGVADRVLNKNKPAAALPNNSRTTPAKKPTTNFAKPDKLIL
jgi:hypothetical protein